MGHEYPFSDLSELNYSKERRILNEQLFYDMNMRIKQTAEKLLAQSRTDAADMVLRLACECSDASCLEKLSLSVEEFDRVHETPNRYAVIKGHEQEDIESVVQERLDYLIVQKFTGV